jgi:hypothetical protein
MLRVPAQFTRLARACAVPGADICAVFVPQEPWRIFWPPPQRSELFVVPKHLG